MSWQLGHPIKRDGTNQTQRLLDALRPERNPIDGRRTEELLLFLYRLAEQFAYYDEKNVLSGHWQIFFDELKGGGQEVSLDSIRRYLLKTEQQQNNGAFMSILLAFLQMFGHLQKDINSLTKKHLDHYYEQTLGFQRLPSQPDEIHVVFELAAHLRQHRLPVGTALKAGKDALGNPLTYITKREVVLNQARLSEIKTVLVKPNGAIYAAKIANSADGQGAPLEGEPPKWPVFGHQSTMQPAMVGFAIASPLLLLREGERTITVTLSFTKPLPEHLKRSDFKRFLAFGSGEEGWIPLTLSVPRNFDSSETIPVNQVRLQIKATSGKPAIVKYNVQKLEGQFNTSFPILRLVLDPNRPSYHLFKELALERIDLQVSVAASETQAGVRALVVQNDQGLLNVNSLFQPFGFEPEKNSLFYIGSQEVFSKPLEDLNIQIQWSGLPENKPIPNGTLAFQLLRDGQWSEPFAKGSKMFTELKLSFLDNTLPRLPIHLDLPELEEYRVGLSQGFIRLVVVNKPSPSPFIQSISLGYSASQLIFSEGPNTNSQFFHLLPFGSEEQTEMGTAPCLPPLSQAALYLGFEDFEPPQNIHLLFQMAEGSAGSTDIIRKEDISWTYLTDKGWRSKPLSGAEIFTDSTLGLQKSGIIAFSLGRDASRNAKLMPLGKHWLRASIEKDPAGAAQAIAIRPQAVTAVFQDQENDPEHLRKPLLANQINSLAERNSAIRKVEQPYNSFGGVPREQDGKFFARVSERLRHKQRAVTIWDIDRLTLQRFPSLYEVKTIPHTGFLTDSLGTYSEFLPGHITVVVIPQLHNQNAVNPLQPRASVALIEQAKRYLASLTTFFTGQAADALHVMNPYYEPIELSFSVGFKAGFDPGFYVEVLNRALQRHLSPWAFEEGVDIRFGGRVYKSQLLAFVEEQEYVDFVTDFKMTHHKLDPGIGERIIEMDFFVRPNQSDKDTDVAEASSAATILVSAEHHLINILKPDEYPCVDFEGCDGGVNCMYIEIDFLIS